MTIQEQQEEEKWLAGKRKMQEIITKAIGGGWKLRGSSNLLWKDCSLWLDGFEGSVMVTPDEYLIDPSFWQSLGKAMEWKIIVRQHGHVGTTNWHQTKIEGWLYHWHGFIDHLAENKSPETFFETL